MASDISITITADPNQAVKDIQKVVTAEKELGKAAKEANAAASDASGGISRMADGAARSLGKTRTASVDLSRDLKKAGRDAAGIASAFGESIPIVGKLGSAISAVIAGPLGIISAAIAAAGMAIQKIMAEAEARVARLKASAEARSSAAYDRLMQGRADYRAQLDTLAQVRELNELAKKSGLTANEQAALRGLSGQLGIDSRYISARGVNPYELDRAEKRLQSSREYNARIEWDDYEREFTSSLKYAIKESGLDKYWKNDLANKSFVEQMELISGFAESGLGASAENIKAFQDLAGMVRQYEQVRQSYQTDAMLGRTQAQLNAEALSGVKSGVQGRLDAEAEAQRLADRIEKERRAQLDAIERANKEESDAAAERRKAYAKQIRGLEKELQIQSLNAEGRQREAYLLRQRLEAEDRFGGPLSEAMAANLDALSGRLYDLQHPESAADPLLAPAPASGRPHAANALRLDRLQRIGANVTNPVASPEKLTLDKSLAVQQSIDSKLTAIAMRDHTFIMRF